MFEFTRRTFLFFCFLLTREVFVFLNMSEKTDLFSNNRLYQLLTNQKIYSEEILKEINSILHTQPELAGLVHPIDGSYFHIMCRNTSEHEK